MLILTFLHFDNIFKTLCKKERWQNFLVFGITQSSRYFVWLFGLTIFF